MLAKFEAADPSCVDGPEDPRRKAEIMAAVKNHFSSPCRRMPPGKVPKIGVFTSTSFPRGAFLFDAPLLTVSVSSRRIKDALPHEVVDKIRSSSLRSKTIAIIEPVQKNKKKSDLAAAVVPSRIVRHVGMGGITSRFQEAGISLSRNRFRQVLIIITCFCFTPLLRLL